MPLPHLKESTLRSLKEEWIREQRENDALLQIADPSYRVDQIKKKLRTGGLHYFQRQLGSTTAILQLVFEWGMGNTIVIVPTTQMAHDLRHKWNKLYFDLPLSQHMEWIYVLRGHHEQDRFRGLNRDMRILIDGAIRLDFPFDFLWEMFPFVAGVY